MLVPDLRKKLSELGLNSKGLKAVLVARLNEYSDPLRQKRLPQHTANDDDDDNERTSEDEDEEVEEAANIEDLNNDEEDENDEDEYEDDEDDIDDEDEVEIEVVTNANPIAKLVQEI